MSNQGKGISEEITGQQEDQQETGVPEINQAVDIDDTDIITEEDPEDPCTVITFGIWGGLTGLSGNIYAFKQTNENYRIEVADYDSLEYEDYLTTRAVKVMAGKGEDLLFLENEERINTYMEKGVLTDLTSYIKRDLYEEDYLTDALYMYQHQERVYAICPTFSMRPLWGNIEDAGESGQILFRDLPQVLEQSGARSLIARDTMATLK